VEKQAASLVQREAEIDQRSAALVHQDARAAAVREKERRLEHAARLEREAAKRQRELDDRAEQLVEVVRGQGKAAVEIDRKAAEVARREKAVAAREAELAALWEAAETSALDRAETALAPRLSALEQREQELARREAALGRSSAEAVPPAEADVRPPSAPAHSEGPTPRVAPPERNLATLQSLVAEHRDAFPDRADEWDAYLHHLRGYADAAGVLPGTFEPLVTETFAELLELQAAGSSTTKVEPPPARTSAQMRPPMRPTSSRQM
jgi:hypothetical protein